MTSTAGDERRRVGRHAIPGVEGTLRRPGDVRVLDVGLFGVSIEAASDVAVGDRMCLELRHGPHRVSVEAEVRWCSFSRVERDRNRLVPVAVAGLEFREILREPDDGGIWSWIDVAPPADLPPNALT